MKKPELATIENCPSSDIAAYIDGELSPDNEIAVELHLVECESCTSELNRQKLLVRAIEFSMKDDLELPADFTRKVVANAESSVGGLRHRREWLNSAFVFCGLLIFVLFALGADAERTFAGFTVGLGRLAAVSGFAAHVIYDLSIGGIVVLRSIASQVGVGGAAVIFFMLFAVSVAGFSRLLPRSCRI